LFPVPTAASRTLAPVPPPAAPEVVFERDRSELIRRAGIGAIALAAMGLLFGIWRWRASLVKTCTFCGSNVAPDASVCKRCFRST
jgi:ribosomal protein L40E